MSFICKSEKNIGEVNGTLREYVHEETGAKLLWLATTDTNKMFSVAFKTLPTDDTGVFHILEHSVLCGSQKYPLKEPFVELLKSSVNTFLNAMTYADKTVYPIASRNEKDFLNLTSVYLDAVFRPQLHYNSNIFYQEGWNLLVDENCENPQLNGVVYNEMKGVEASIDSIIINKLTKAVYPDTCYGRTFGGDTKKIPELTYEVFKETHEKFYNPANAIFYLEGDMNTEPVFNMIEEYLLAETTEYDQEFFIPEQAPVKPATIRGEYGVSPEDESGNIRISLGKILCDFDDKAKIYGANMLCGYLTESNEAPLKMALLERGLCQDMWMQADSGTRQPLIHMELTGCCSDDIEAVKAVVREVLAQQLSGELNKVSLEGSLNNMEFISREVSEPKARDHYMSVMSSYIYGGKPELYLENEETLRYLRKQLETDYFEKLLTEILDTDSMSAVIMTPSNTLLEKEMAEEAQRAETLIEKMSDSEKNELHERNRQLELWHMTPSTKEELDTLPRLTIDDIDKSPAKSKMEVRDYGDTKVLVHPSDVTGLAYVTMYFEIPADLKDKLTDISILSNLYGDMPTANRGLFELVQDIKMNMGAFDTDLDVYAQTGNRDECKTYLVFSFSALKEKISDAFEIVKDVMFNTDFSYKDYVEDILLQMKENFRYDIIDNGHIYGMKKASAGFSAVSEVSELISGIRCYERLKEICENFDDNYEAFAGLSEVVKNRILKRNNLIISIAANQEDAADADFFAKYKVDEIIETFEEGEQFCGLMPFENEKICDTFVQIPGGVSYACAVNNVMTAGSAYNGAWKVASKILSLGYLWDVVRMQGGAYNCEVSIGQSGGIAFYSYRDPNGRKTFDAFDRAGDYLREFATAVSQMEKVAEELEGFVISVISESEPLLGPKELADYEDGEYFSGADYNEECRIRKEILEISCDDLIACADVLDAMVKGTGRCFVSAYDDRETAEIIII